MEIIKGRIKKGRGLGKKLGFPTLNIDYDGDLEGVFAARVKLQFEEGDFELAAAVHLGPRPTLDDEERICEIFVLDFPEKLLDKNFEQEIVEVNLVAKVRDVEKFDTLEDLQKQIAKDVEDIRNLLQ